MTSSQPFPVISVVIPVYNNEGSLCELQNRLDEDLIAPLIDSHKVEIIYVNDGSPDNSLSVLRKLSEQHAHVRVVKLSRNFGQYYAILAGWSIAKGDAIIEMAADLQDPPAVALEFVKQWDKGHKVVIAHREDHKTGFVNKVTSKLFYTLVLKGAPSGGFDFTLLDRQVVESIMRSSHRFRFLQSDVLNQGFDPVLVPYEKVERHSGKSAYNTWSRLKWTSRYFFDLSKLPIQSFIYTGVITVIMGGIYAVRLIMNYLGGGAPFKGWTPIVLMLLFFGGLILIGIGIIGEYIWRIYEEVKNKPLYIIDEVYENGEST